MARPPSRSINSAVSSIVSGRFISERCFFVDRPVQYTVAPAAPSSTAIPRPAPRVAPATNATLAASDVSMVCPFLLCCHCALEAAQQLSECNPNEGTDALCRDLCPLFDHRVSLLALHVSPIKPPNVMP